MSRVPALEGGRRVGEWIKYTYSAYFPQPHRNQPLAKNGRLSRFAKQPPNGRLDLDRLAAFCYLSKLVGLRLTKPRRSESSRACALRRSCGDGDKDTDFKPCADIVRVLAKRRKLRMA